MVAAGLSECQLVMNAPLEQIWHWLEQVPDPEIPVISVVDLGIVRGVKWQDDCLEIAVTPTYSGCPATAIISADIKTILRRHGIENIRINQQISPAWTTDWLTKTGRKKLLKYGIAPPQISGRPANCPQCNSTDLEKISQFGSTPCKALWRCLTCAEPFDYFKCH